MTLHFFLATRFHNSQFHIKSLEVACLCCVNGEHPKPQFRRLSAHPSPFASLITPMAALLRRAACASGPLHPFQEEGVLVFQEMVKQVLASHWKGTSKLGVRYSLHGDLRMRLPGRMSHAKRFSHVTGQSPREWWRVS